MNKIFIILVKNLYSHVFTGIKPIFVQRIFLIFVAILGNIWHILTGKRCKSGCKITCIALPNIFFPKYPHKYSKSLFFPALYFCFFCNIFYALHILFFNRRKGYLLVFPVFFLCFTKSLFMTNFPWST